MSLLPAALAVGLLLVGGAYDLFSTRREAWIPWWLSAGGGGLAAALAATGSASWSSILLGAMVGAGAVFLAIILAGEPGGWDDVLLAGVGGAFLGPWGAMWMLLWGAAAGGAVELIRRRNRRVDAWLRRWAAFHGVSPLGERGDTPIPFVPCLAVGALASGLLLLGGVLQPWPRW